MLCLLVSMPLETVLMDLCWHTRLKMKVSNGNDGGDDDDYDDDDYDGGGGGGGGI